ncbi:MAG: DNA primase small subunit domain-containing protein [Promethearchaeota archaeon]|jgi:DNA primase small subunit
MTDLTYLQRLFQAYYQEQQKNLPKVSSFNLREFGFIPWEKKVFMKRHMKFENSEQLLGYLNRDTPRHMYSSGSIYLEPDARDMKDKKYQGCDFIIDIDVDHFFTPCKEKHDLWYCKECGAEGTGMPDKCPKCKKSKFAKLNWVCDDCLNIAKHEIKTLVDDFLIPDFGIDTKDMRIAFSGHRGYHLKVESAELRTLNSDERREIVDYLTGDNISFELLGLVEKTNVIFGLLTENLGWSQKIMNKVEELLQKPDTELEIMLKDNNSFAFNHNVVKIFLNYKDDFLELIKKGERNVWAIEGFGLTMWKRLLKEIVKQVGVELDEPVSIDIHRLIRYPGSLHGKTGFKAQELTLDEFEEFNPLNEPNEKLDPIVFTSKKGLTHKLEILEKAIPITKIKGVEYGPYSKGEKIEVPHHMAVFLLCKEVAKTI